MKLTDQVADRVANFAFGVCSLGLGVASLPAATASMAALPAVIGAGTILGFALAAKQRHAVDHKATLDRIRNALAAEWLSDQSFGWNERVEIEAACDLLDRHLEKCMLSPKELAEAAAGNEGRRFPEAATELVISALARQCSDFLRSPIRDFAGAVITRAFDIAVEDEAYFKKFQPHLLMETARVSGMTLGAVGELKGRIHALPEATASAVAVELHAMEARILKAIVANRNGDSDPVSEEELKVAVGRMLRSGDARKQHALRLAADGDVAGATGVLTELTNLQQASLADATTQAIETLRELGALSLHSNPATAVAAYQRAYSLSTGDLEIS